MKAIIKITTMEGIIIAKEDTIAPGIPFFLNPIKDAVFTPIKPGML